VQGGNLEPLTSVDAQRGETHHTAPAFLPDGKGVLFTVRTNGADAVEVVELATGTRRLLTEGRNPVYLSSGHLLLGRDDVLVAAPFDLARRELTGPAVRVLEGTRVAGDLNLNFGAALQGTVVYMPGLSMDRRLVWVDREGRSQVLDDDPKPFQHPRLSPDGSRVVVAIRGEMWVYDLARGTRAKLTPPGARPVWTADGQRITFTQPSGLYTVPADDNEPAQLLLAREPPFNGLFPLAWSRDGRLLMFSAPVPPTGRDVWTLTRDGVRVPILATARDERAAMFSPDGRWMVYAALETGRDEMVYVQPYPGPAGRVAISPGGGVEPVWSPTGGEIFYRSPDGSDVLAVRIRTEPSLEVGAPVRLFSGSLALHEGTFWSNYDVARDGQRFLMLEHVETQTPRMNVIVGWTPSSR
jgi:serine/threonine-protein kinase